MANSKRGLFITVEGIEGAGKSTCLNAIGDALTEADITNPVVTREPGGTKLGEAIRSILLDAQFRGMGADSEALLMFAARAEHVACVIRPNLQAGRWVVCDRFTDASYAYQGAGRGLGEERVTALEDWCCADISPDLTLLLDVDPKVGKRRISTREAGADRFEEELDEFFRLVRNAYLRRAEVEPGRFSVIDANQATDDVTAQVQRVIRDLTESI